MKLLYAPEPDAVNTIDRGDDLPEDDTPTAPPADLKDDPEVQKLEADLKDDADAPADKKADPRIPLARHKEILEREREARAALERQLAQYQKGNQLADMNAELTAAEDAIVKMDKDYRALLVDGDLDKAGELMTKIRKAEREMAEAKSDMKIHAAEVRATERARYNIAVERIEAAYPELNPDHESYDAEVTTEVMDLKDAYQLKGLTPTAAMQKAVKTLLDPRTSRQAAAITNTPRVADRDVAAERKKEAVAKTSAAIASQAPNMNKVGVNSDKLGGAALDAKAVMKLSQAEFARIGEAELARIRGDEFVPS